MVKLEWWKLNQSIRINFYIPVYPIKVPKKKTPATRQGVFFNPRTARIELTAGF
jgi:hypothetical protein